MEAKGNPLIILHISATTYGEMFANSELIAEAFNVTNETGLSPKELKEQRDELIEGVERANEWLKQIGDSRFYPNYLNQLLKKVKP